MDLRALEAVVAVEEHGSFSAAAGALFVSQPALTRRVALLERELDTRIFVRAARGVYLTDAGRALIGPAKRALGEADSIRVAIEMMRNNVGGSISIVGMPNLSAAPLGRLIARFHELHPEVDIRVVSAESTAAALATVEAGANDIAIVDRPVAAESIHLVRLLDEDFLAVFSPGSTGTDQATGIPAATAGMLRGRTLVHLPIEQFPKHRGAQLFSMLGAEEPRSHLEVSSCTMIPPILRTPGAVALLPRAAAMATRNMGMDIAEPPQAIKRTLALARHRSNRSPSIMQFLRLATALQELAA